MNYMSESWIENFWHGFKEDPSQPDIIKVDIDIEEINELIEELDQCMKLLGYEREALERMEEESEND